MSIERPYHPVIEGIIIMARGLALNFPLRGSGEHMTFMFTAVCRVSDPAIISALQAEFPAFIFEVKQDIFPIMIKVIAPKTETETRPS